MNALSVKVVCVNAKDVSLTKGKIYKAIVVEDWYYGTNIYTVVNDRGRKEDYNHDRFKIVEEEIDGV